MALAGQPTWPETVVEEIEHQASRIAEAHEDASALKDHGAVACLAEPAGAAHNALQHAEAAEERWERAVEDDNAYAIETEVLELQRQQARANRAYSQAYECWPTMAHDHSGPPLALSAAPLWVSLGGARHVDPGMNGGETSLVGIGAAGLRGSADSMNLSGTMDAEVWAERWETADLNHWAGVDGTGSLLVFPDARLRLQLQEDLHRDPRLTSSPLGGTVSLVEHDGRLAVVTGWHAQASLGFDHRLQRAVLEDGTRQVQQFGPSAGLSLPLRNARLAANTHLHRVLRAETQGRELRTTLDLSVPVSWWASLTLTGGWNRLYLDNRFSRERVVVGAVSLAGTRDSSSLWLGVERDYGSTWLDQGTLQHAATGGFEGWMGPRLMLGLDGRYATTAFYPTVIPSGLSDTQVLTVEGVVGLRLVESVRVDLRGQRVQRWGNGPATDTAVGLHLVIDP